MEWIRPATARGRRWLQSTHAPTSPCVARQAKHPIPGAMHARENIRLYRISALSHCPATSPRSEGRIAIVTKRWDGVRWTRQRWARRHVRRAVFRERSTACRRTALKRLCQNFGWSQMAGDGLVKEAAYGKSVWFWHPWLVSNRRRFSRVQPGSQNRQFAGDGGKRNSSPGRARYKP